MSLALLSFIVLSLFMIHEFDEIILVKPWIKQNQDHPAYQKEMFIAGKSSYPSAESLALMIAEEFILAFLLLLVAILCRFSELAIAITLCHTLHLLGHISQVIKFRSWVPGGLTAVLTFPILLVILAVYLSRNSVSWVLLILLSILVMLALLGNLLFLHKQAPIIHAWIYRISKRN
mgnify:FL=1